ncbi:MAG: glycoside hydrolase family protein [Carboxylicivirga sp.]|jgi:hypothetical protein|nr:glycoside hydrolase family protein [Carboxylicivirga sp.]
MNRRTFINRTFWGGTFAAFTGCSVFNKIEQKEASPFANKLLPAVKGGGFYDPDYWIWGSSVIKGEDGHYHMFASRWSKKYGFGNWVTNSQIVRAVSKTPEGPYDFQEVVTPIRGKEYWDGLCTHNPRVIKYKNQYLLYYFGTTYNFPVPTDNNKPKGGFKEAWSNKRLGVAVSDSVFGPWKRLDKPIIEPRTGFWDASITSNPAPAVNTKSGDILLMYKSSAKALVPPLLLGVTSASNAMGPYNRLSEEPIFRFETTNNNRIDVEDPFVWWNGKMYEAIMKDRSGLICGEEGGGVHAWSKDGVSWTLFDKVKAYSRNILWNDGSRTYQNHFERPFLLIEDGQPTHLFAATGDGEKAWNFKNTWNMVIPLKTRI